MLLRSLARPMLASMFVYGGINALRNAEGHAQGAKPFLDKTVGANAESLPPAVPTDYPTLVKVDAGVKIGAGALLAIGKFQRFSALALIGSLVPTTLAGHPFWEHESEEERASQTIHFLKNLSMAGGLLMAAQDKKGKPSAAWRAQHAAELTGKNVKRSKKATKAAAKGAKAGAKAGEVKGRAS
jgi:uncharacterized membrane protein YphA (DoxX/SURF4 family)